MVKTLKKGVFMKQDKKLQEFAADTMEILSCNPEEMTWDEYFAKYIKGSRPTIHTSDQPYWMQFGEFRLTVTREKPIEIKLNLKKQ